MRSVAASVPLARMGHHLLKAYPNHGHPASKELEWPDTPRRFAKEQCGLPSSIAPTDDCMLPPAWPECRHIAFG